MNDLEQIAERIHLAFEQRSSVRDQALAHSRNLIRHCANAIRAIHRSEYEHAAEHLGQARQLVDQMQTDLKDFPEIYFAGYTQDALKEYAEASLVYQLIKQQSLPSPEDLHLEYATYLQGLAESAGELRRRCLDALLNGNFEEAERCLSYMDDIYDVLVTMDYPDAITGGLRRLTDIVRSVTERTRGDLTLSLRQEILEKSLKRIEINHKPNRSNENNPGI